MGAHGPNRLPQLTFDIFSYDIAQRGAKRWHEHAGSGASIACEMPAVLSDLLAPREAAREAILPLLYFTGYQTRS